MVLAIALVIPATMLIFLPLNALVGLVAGVTMWAGAVGALWLFSPVISVTEGTLQVGNARLEHRYIGKIASFDGDAARHEKGPGAHGLAWLTLSPWVDAVAKITVEDPEDPTPYWLVSTRKPDELMRALGKN
jgi:hypothetical protein